MFRISIEHKNFILTLPCFNSILIPQKISHSAFQTVNLMKLPVVLTEIP